MLHNKWSIIMDSMHLYTKWQPSNVDQGHWDTNLDKHRCWWWYEMRLGFFQKSTEIGNLTKRPTLVLGCPVGWLAAWVVYGKGWMLFFLQRVQIVGCLVGERASRARPVWPNTASSIHRAGPTRFTGGGKSWRPQKKGISVFNDINCPITTTDVNVIVHVIRCQWRHDNQHHWCLLKCNFNCLQYCLHKCYDPNYQMSQLSSLCSNVTLVIIVLKWYF